MLNGQIGSNVRFSNFTPKVEGFGVGMEFGLSENIQNGDESLSKNTMTLINTLIKNQSVTSLQATAQVDNSKIYHDNDFWFHGLYSIKMSSQHEITYVLWKVKGNAIFILLGSPTNVIGNKNVVGGTNQPLWTNRIMGNLMDSSLQDQFQGAIRDCESASPDEKYSDTTYFPEFSGYRIKVDKWTNLKQFAAKIKVIRGSGLAVFCNKSLTCLPQTKVETMFKIYYSLPVSRSIAPYDVVYLGSPIFTALA